MQERINIDALANRLARAIASDIALYNKEKIMRGLKNDTLFDEIAQELEEGREHYQNRVASEIWMATNFYERALVDLIFKAMGEHAESAIW